MLSILLPMSFIRNANVLITGASSGIGRELARQMAPDVKSLSLLARRTERLLSLQEELQKKNPSLQIEVVSCDLLEKNSIDQALKDLNVRVGRIDVLVNNAGIGDGQLFENSSWEIIERMIQLNVQSLTYLTRKLIPSMIENQKGGILNISSGFGVTFAPGYAAYVGTKHYVTGFTESLRLELAPLGIRVSQSCPGPVATEFESVAGNPFGRPTPRWIFQSAENCASTTLRGFKAGKAMIFPGWIYQSLMILNSLTPRWLMRLILLPVAKKIRASSVKRG